MKKYFLKSTLCLALALAALSGCFILLVKP